MCISSSSFSLLIGSVFGMTRRYLLPFLLLREEVVVKLKEFKIANGLKGI
jgi:hypothetical protein